MKERIRELAEQSGCKVMDGEWYIPSATGVEKIVYTKGIGLEKFAELIVRECVAQIEIEKGNPYRNMGDIDSYGISACVESIRRIKEHFGVEE